VSRTNAYEMRAIAIAANRNASGTARPMSPAGATPFRAIAAVGAMIPIEIAIASQKRSSRLRCPRVSASSAVAAVAMPASWSNRWARTIPWLGPGRQPGNRAGSLVQLDRGDVPAPEVRAERRRAPERDVRRMGEDDRVVVADQHRRLAVLVDPDDLARLVARDIEEPVGAEPEPVRQDAVELHVELRIAGRAVGADRDPRDPPRPRLPDIDPRPGGRHRHP